MLSSVYFRFLCAIAIVAFSSDTAVAQQQLHQNTSDSLYSKSIKLNIVSITIDGSLPKSKDEILSHVKTQPGDRFDRDKLRQDLESINKMGCFDSSRLVMYSQLVDGGVSIAIRLLDRVPQASTVQKTHVAEREDFRGTQNLRVGENCSLFRVRDLWGRYVISEQLRTRIEYMHSGLLQPVLKSFVPWEVMNRQDWTNLRGQLDQFLDGRRDVLPGYDAI